MYVSTVLVQSKSTLCALKLRHKNGILLVVPGARQASLALAGVKSVECGVCVRFNALSLMQNKRVTHSALRRRIHVAAPAYSLPWTSGE